MPVPVLSALGFIPWLVSVFTGMVAYFATYLGKKISIIAASITLFLAIGATFKTAIDSALNALSASVPSGAFLFGLGLLPANTSTVLTAILTAQTASVVYIYARNIIYFRLTAV